MDYLNNHEFFWQHQQGFHSAKIRLKATKTYDLRIQPNAEAKGIPVEADENGWVVAVEYANGQKVRNNQSYVVVLGPTENILLDRYQNFHPLD